MSRRNFLQARWLFCSLSTTEWYADICQQLAKTHKSHDTVYRPKRLKIMYSSSRKPSISELQSIMVLPATGKRIPA